ncbi:MAG: response regulator, partial [Rhodospirillaceae bacterium]
MKRCLIVDDSRVIRRVAAKIVQDLGFETEEADNGEKALKALAIRMPDVLLVDNDMPQMDGLRFLRELRKMPEGKKPMVLFCTVGGDVKDIREAIDAGADEHVMKPFD